MAKKTDLRVLRTRKSIKDAFYTLIAKKKYDKISIQDITDEAFINRNTFYLHYMDKDDLIDKLSEEAFNKFRASLEMDSSYIEDQHAELTGDMMFQVVRSTFEALESDLPFYRIVFKEDEIPYLKMKLTRIVKEHMLKGFGIEDIRNKHIQNTSKEGIYVEYMAAGLIGLMNYWVNNYENCSVDEMASIIIEMYTEDVLQQIMKRKENPLR